MNNKLKLAISLLLTCGLGFSVIGCAKKNDQAAAKNDISSEKKVTIRLWTKPNQDALPGAIKQYEARMAKVKAKFPNITIEDVALQPGSNYRQEYDKALMAGNAPTGWWQLPYVDVPSRIKNGTIADITDLVNSWDLKKQGKVWTAFDEAISTKDGKWYAVPGSCYVMGTLVNKKVLGEGGGDVNNLPKTWSDFAAVAQKVTDKTKPRFGYEMVGMDWNAWPFTAWVWSAGGEMVRHNTDGTYKIAFNEEQGVDAAVFMNELVWKYEATQKDVLQDWSKLEDDIKSGRAVFSWYNASSLNQDMLSNVGLQVSDFGIMKMPVKDSSIPQPSFSGGEVITFNPKASKEEIKAAFDVLTYMRYDEEVLTEQWKIADEYKMADMVPSVRTDLTEKKMSILTAIPENLKKDITDAAKTAKPEPYCPDWNNLKNELAKPLQQILLKKGITRDEVKKILDTAADTLYSKYPNSFKK